MDNIKSKSIFNKLNHVLKIISLGKLKDDIDDSLLEKLISFIRKENEKSENFVPEMLKKTDLEKYLTEGLNGAFTSTSQPTLGFLLKLLSACNNHPAILSTLEKEENKLLSLLSKIFEPNNYSLWNFSVKASILEFLSLLASDRKYIVWLHRNGAVDFGRRGLTEDSLYVRRAAALLIATLLSSWLRASRDDAINGNICLNLFRDTARQLFLYLGPSSVSSKPRPSDQLVQSTVQVFTIFSQLKPENAEWFPVKKVLDIINWHSTATTTPDPGYLDKLLRLLSIFVSPWRDRPAVDGLITKLLGVKLFPSVLHFLSLSIVRHASQGRLSEEILDVFLAAVSYVTEAGNIPAHTVSCLRWATRDKSSTIETINSNISAINTISKILTRQQNREIGSRLGKLLALTVGPTVTSTLQGYCSGCRKLQISVLNYFLSGGQIYEDEDQPDRIFDLAAVVIKLIEDARAVPVVMDKCAKILGNLLSDWGKLCAARNIAWSNFWPSDHLGKALVRRLLDPDWEVIDSTLGCLNRMMFTHSDVIPWLCRNSIHGLVWNLATSQIYPGYVRASAIGALSGLVSSPPAWERLRREQRLSPEDASNLFCRALSSPSDTFVRRAAARAIFSRIERGEVAPLFYKSLYAAVTADLDWEVKIRALRSWELILKRHLPPSTHHPRPLLTQLCGCGLAAALMGASRDADNGVKSLAVTILLDLSRRFRALNTDPRSTTGDGGSAVDVGTEDEWEIFSGTTPVNQPNRRRIMEDVLDTDTDRQLLGLMKPVPEDGHVSDTLDRINPEVDPRDFLRFLSSENWTAVLEESRRSTDLYTDNLESLLDDMVDSEETKFPGMDCY